MDNVLIFCLLQINIFIFKDFMKQLESHGKKDQVQVVELQVNETKMILVYVDF